MKMDENGFDENGFDEFIQQLKTLALLSVKQAALQMQWSMNKFLFMNISIHFNL
jgi:hypothetical protein